MTTPVKFELAKLLKEKGLIFKTNMFYPDLSWNQDTLYDSLQVEGYSNCQELSLESWGDVFPAPTIAEVVMWLYEKHDIDVSAYGKLPYIVFPDSEYGEGELQWHFEYRVIQNIDGQKCEVIEPKTWYDTKTEAYEAAIEYTLKNLL